MHTYTPTRTRAHKHTHTYTHTCTPTQHPHPHTHTTHTHDLSAIGIHAQKCARTHTHTLHAVYLQMANLMVSSHYRKEKNKSELPLQVVQVYGFSRFQALLQCNVNCLPRHGMAHSRSLESWSHSQASTPSLCHLQYEKRGEGLDGFIT